MLNLFARVPALQLLGVSLFLQQLITGDCVINQAIHMFSSLSFRCHSCCRATPWPHGQLAGAHVSSARKTPPSFWRVIISSPLSLLISEFISLMCVALEICGTRNVD